MITFLQETPGDGAKRMMYNVQDYRVFFSFYFFYDNAIRLLYGWVDILITGEKHLDDSFISLTRQALAHKTSLFLPSACTKPGE